ncbi:MAG: hypothetical protein WC309_02095 [Candidatus Paceibacterota bacterium]|jgi:hypothetical protein
MHIGQKVVPIIKLKNFMDYNEDILNETEGGEDWSEEEAAGEEGVETPSEELDDDWASEDEDA